MPRLLQLALGDVPPIVRGLGHLDDEVALLLEAVDDLEQPLALGRAEPAEERAPPHRDQEEDLPEDDPETLDELRHLLEVGGGVAADGGVDLERQPDLVGPPDRLHGLREGARYPAERVVLLRPREVECSTGICLLRTCHGEG